MVTGLTSVHWKHGHAHRVDGRFRPAKALARRVLTMWWTVWGAIVVVGALIASPSIAEIPLGGVTFAAGFVLAVIGAATIPYLRYRRWRYEIRERDLFLSHGSWVYVLTLIPSIGTSTWRRIRGRSTSPSG